MAIVEVTHSDRWEAHLKHDVARTLALRGSVAAFMFIAWAKAPPLEVLLHYRTELVGMGIPSDAIFLVFREQLLREMQQPKYARLWVDPLKLPVSSLPFEWVEQATQLFGSEERAETFAPSLSEYRNSQVHRPIVADQVERQLAQAGWALVRGLGASGKTVLAASIALGDRFVGAYYLDLADFEGADDLPAAIDSLTTHADDGVLFVIDNVHLNERSARHLYDHWQQSANRSRLLLVGRITTPPSDERGRISPLADLDQHAFELKVEARDLLGVYLRLARRWAASARITEPLSDAVAAWVRLFGGDLLAFSAAVARKANRLARGDWSLEPRDALSYVRNEYVDGLTAAEKKALIRLATLARIEYWATSRCLEEALPKRLLMKGLILSARLGRPDTLRFRLVHPGFGDLLRPALPSFDDKTILCEMATEDTALGIDLAARLRNLYLFEEAEELLRVIAASSEFFSPRFYPRTLPRTVQLFSQLKVMTAEELEQRLVPHIRELVVASRLTPVEALTPFLRFVNRHLPLVFESVGCSMGEPAGAMAIVESALQGQLAGIPSFLRFARVALPQVHREVCRLLCEKRSIEIMARSALGSNLSQLSSFLIFAMEELPAVFEGLSSYLGYPENRTLLETAVLGKNLGHLGEILPFLRLSRAHMPVVYEGLIIVLAAPSNVETLCEFAWRVPLGQLASFLRFAQIHAPLLCRVVCACLEQPGAKTRLGHSALRTQLSELPAFLRYARSELPVVHEVLCRYLSEPEPTRFLLELALRTKPDSLSLFLRDAKDRLPVVYLAMEDFLSRPESLVVLTNTALRSPLHFLPPFLRYAADELPCVYEGVCRNLLEPMNAELLVDSALRTPLEHLTAFIRFTRGSFSALYESLVTLITRPAAIASLAEVVTEASLDSVMAFVRESEVAGRILTAIDTQRWNERWLREPGVALGGIAEMARELCSVGYPKLANVLITRAIEEIHVADNATSPQGNHSLATIVEISATLEAGPRDLFLRLIATRSLLETVYAKSSIGSLAKTLFRFWLALDEEWLARFVDRSLLVKAAERLAPLKVDETSAIADKLNLVGALSLVSRTPPLADLTGFQQFHIERSLAANLPKHGGPLRACHTRLWLGMREVARQQQAPLWISTAAGERFRELWRHAKTRNLKLASLDAGLLSWLDDCAGAGWLLVPDRKTER
ncbi:MAG TPA: hypothetical protein VH988_31030 [Thermoanaerobaculia bacterium]|nr:hypothetical protein [Thermoanaerobaculia bacterium]